jgi:predicted nuclease of predicted toxin-antitoxin system
VRILVDACLSPRLAEALNAKGHEAVHLVSYGMESAPDPEVLARAAAEDQAVLSADTDFGTILGRTRATRPSVILFRLETDRRVDELVDLIEANRATIETAVEEGSIIVIGDALVRVRSLPIL